MKLSLYARAVICAVVLTVTSQGASVVMQALPSFGGDGWLAPGEAPPDGLTASVLTTGNTERGLDYSPTLNHLYVVSRAAGAQVFILDAATGNQIGQLNVDTSIVSGGAAGFTVNMVSVASDGAIYVGNLSDQTSVGSKPFRVYRWADETSTPELVFSGDGGIAGGTRLGDTMDVIGSGANTRLVAGYGNLATTTGENGYLLIKPDAITPEFSSVLVTGVNDGDFRSGITFIDENTVWGDSGASSVRRVRHTGTVGGVVSGTLEGTLALTSTNERPVDYAVINGVPLLTTVESSTGNTVHIYDVSDPTVRLELATLNLTSGLQTNANGTGAITWGNITGNVATLYAMNTNNGIQAFVIQVIPEPSTAMLLSVAALVGVCRRRRPSPLSLARSSATN